MYKHVILNIKRKNQNDFWIFLKYWPYLHDFNKLVIKVKMHAKTYIFFWKYWQSFFNVLMKIRYFNTRFVSLRYKNTNQY